MSPTTFSVQREHFENWKREKFWDKFSSIICEDMCLDCALVCMSIWCVRHAQNTQTYVGAFVKYKIATGCQFTGDELFMTQINSTKMYHKTRVHYEKVQTWGNQILSRLFYFYQNMRAPSTTSKKILRSTMQNNLWSIQVNWRDVKLFDNLLFMKRKILQNIWIQKKSRKKVCKI